MINAKIFYKNITLYFRLVYNFNVRTSFLQNYSIYSVYGQ